MATKFVDEFKQGVTCPQCQQLYKINSYRLLPCLHTLCIDCVHKLPVVEETCINTEPKAFVKSTQDTQHVHEDCASNDSRSKADKTSTDSSLTYSETVTPATVVNTTCKFIKCPLCQTNCQMREKGLDSFQTPVIVSNHLSLLETLENLTREGGPKCRHCHDSPQAVAYCYQHRYLICELCWKMHETWVDYQSHKVVGIEELTRTGDAVEQGEEASTKGIN